MLSDSALSILQWLPHYRRRIVPRIGADTTTFWSPDLERYDTERRIVDGQQIIEMSTRSSAAHSVPALDILKEILRQAATTTIDMAKALLPTNENSQFEGEDEQIHRDPEHNHRPGLELKTIPQPETETETQRDPEDDKETENET